MSACSQCGTVAKATDKFCNVCGTPLARTGAAHAPPQSGAGPQYAPTPPAGPGAYAPPPPLGLGAPNNAPVARCQMGHEIAPGATYCAHNHPIALDQMQFGAPPQPNAYAPPQPNAYAPPAPAYGAPPAQAPAYGAPPAQAAAYGQPAPQPYAPPAAFGGSPMPPPGYAPAQGGYAPAQPPYGAPPGAYAPAGPAFGVEAPVPPRILRGFLVAYGSNPNGDYWPLTGGRLVVGRLGAVEGIDLSMQDPTISSRHAAMVIDAASGMISVEDTGSTNGTFVNDEHIGFNGRRELRDGDRLRFGGYSTIVKIIGRV